MYSYVDALSLSTTLAVPQCNSTGSITYNISGGIQGYTATIKPVSGPAVPITGGFVGSLYQDFYTISVTDAHNCKKSFPVKLAEPCMNSVLR
jgi:hypothetical protein